MRSNLQRREVLSDGLSNSRESFNIKGSAKLFSMLSDKLYSDKPLAVLRELIGNGLDAQKQVGKSDVPIFVQLPTMLQPELVIQDFGTGMTHDFMMNGWCTVGHSEKDHSDDFIGGFGVGRMAGFAYTQQFTVESIVSGEKRQYSCFLNDDHIPEVVQLGSTQDTVKPNGVRVSIQVKSEDIRKFEEKFRSLVRYMDVRPDTNLELEYDYAEPFMTGADGDWQYYNEEGYYSYNTTKYSVAVMGGIPYKIDSSQFTEDTGLLKQLVLFFDIGQLDLAPSREALSYDKQTVKLIADRLDKVKQELTADTQAVIDAASSEWEASLAYSGSSAIVQRHKLGTKLSYKGKPIDKHVPINLLHTLCSKVTDVGHGSSYKLSSNKSFAPEFDDATYTYVDYKTKQSKTVSRDVTITPEGNQQIVLCSTKSSRIPSRLCQHWKDENLNGGAVIFKLEEGDDADFRKYLTQLGVPDDRIIDFEKDVDLYKVTRALSGTTTSVKTNLYCASTYTISNRYSMYSSNDFKEMFEATPDVDIDSTKGFYIEVKSWEPDNDKYGRTDFVSIVTRAIKLGFINVNQQIYAVTKAAKNPLKDHSNWQDFFEFVEQKLDEAVDNFDVTGYIKGLKRKQVQAVFSNSHSRVIKDHKEELKSTLVGKIVNNTNVLEGSAYDVSSLKMLHRDIKGTDFDKDAIINKQINDKVYANVDYLSKKLEAKYELLEITDKYPSTDREVELFVKLLKLIG